MTFNEWFSKQKLIGGNIVETAYDISQKAWEAAQHEAIEKIAYHQDLNENQKESLKTIVEKMK